MNIKDINKAIKLAKTNGVSFNKSVIDAAFEVFHGIAYETKKKYATIEMVAWFIRYESFNLDGSFNEIELNNIVTMLKEKILIRN